MPDLEGIGESYENILYAVAFIFGAALAIFIFFYIFAQMSTPMADAINSALPDNAATFNVTSMTNKVQGGLGLFDTLYPMLIIGCLIMVGVSSFYIGKHPVLFFVSLVIFGAMILMGGIFSNVYQELTSDSSFGNTTSSFPISQILMQNLPVIVLIIIIVGAIFLFGKPGGASGGL